MSIASRLRRDDHLERGAASTFPPIFAHRYKVQIGIRARTGECRTWESPTTAAMSPRILWPRNPTPPESIPFSSFSSSSNLYGSRHFILPGGRAQALPRRLPACCLLSGRNFIILSYFVGRTRGASRQGSLMKIVLAYRADWTPPSSPMAQRTLSAESPPSPTQARRRTWAWRALATAPAATSTTGRPNAQDLLHPMLSQLLRGQHSAPPSPGSHGRRGRKACRSRRNGQGQ